MDNPEVSSPGVVTPGVVTQLLEEWTEGNAEAFDKLVPLIYDELRRLARRVRRERGGHTLQTTALVHEAYLRLVDQTRTHWRNRAHFLAIAARMMRRIVVDHARRQAYAKRGGKLRRLPLEEAPDLSVERAPEMLALDDALKSLAEIEPQLSEIVEMRFFGGLDNRELGQVLGVSIPTVTRRLRLGRAWLYRYFAGEPQPERSGAA